MIAIMYDGLELGRFYKEPDNKIKLVLNDGISKHWLPYIFEIGLDMDMNVIYQAWLKERIFPKNRIGMRKTLKSLGLNKYNINKIAEITRCSLITDPYWIAYSETDRYTINSIRGQIGGKRYPYNSLHIKDEGKFIWRI